MWSGLISLNQWWRWRLDPCPKALICNISTLMCYFIYIDRYLYSRSLLLWLWSVLSPPGCDIWFPRPGHNSSQPSEVDLQKPIRLYNIEKDPEERNEVSVKFPAVVDYLLARLYYYQKSTVPINFPENDPKCDPGPTGAWGPWTWMAFFTGSIRLMVSVFFKNTDNHNWYMF